MGACTSPAAPPGDSSGSNGLSESEKVGIGVGVSAGVILLGAGAFFAMKSQAAATTESGATEPMLNKSV